MDKCAELGAIMLKSLTVFVDAYPYQVFKQSEVTRLLSNVASVTPGLGYSVSCQAELFSGHLPDDLGAWCEYSYEPWRMGALLKPALQLLDVARGFRIPNRIAHKVADRVLRTSTKDIPFGYLPYFRKRAVEPMGQAGAPDSAIHADGVTRISYLTHPAGTPERTDARIYEAALEHLAADETRKLFVAFGALDHVGHWKGLGSCEYEAVRRETDTRVLSLLERFRGVAPNGRFLLLSDHGMANVHRGIEPGLERVFGPPSRSRYVYFVEGTILRVWVHKEQLRKPIASYLADMGGVEVVDELERRRLGIGERRHGDIVALTSEGSMWCPSFWGPLICKGMHGYHPRYASQKAFVASDGGPKFAGALMAREVASMLKCEM